MTTIVIQIGNTDDKLTQQEWASYCNDITGIIAKQPVLKTHFSGGSYPFEPWQNACWVMEVKSGEFFEEQFQVELKKIRQKYKQDSIAYTVGETYFI